MGLRSKVAGALVAAGLLLGSLLLALLAGEGVLRLVLNPADFLHATLVDDPLLGHRIAPGTSGHDALGYRNRRAPEQADIVAIGDSNTYGVSAPREGSWPHQLGEALGQPVYNMGLGGYGPLQYLELARSTAKALKPKQLIVGFYFGNDLMDAHLVAHANPRWQDWRMADVQADTVAPGPVEEPPRKRFEALRDWLSRNSMLYSVLRATVLPRFAAEERAAMARSLPPDRQWPWVDPAGPGVRTTFTPQTRLSAVDPALPPVREGLDISKRALAALQAEAQTQGARLLVVLIPTKERAYCSYLRAQAAATPMPASLQRLCDAEPKAAAELTAFLDQQHIARLDVLPILEAGIARHQQLYPADADGHLETRGYGVVAAAIADVLRPAGRSAP